MLSGRSRKILFYLGSIGDGERGISPTLQAFLSRSETTITSKLKLCLPAANLWIFSEISKRLKRDILDIGI